MKKPAEKARKILGAKLKIQHHLQHSSLESFHEWVTHSVHASETDARKIWANVINNFPSHFKWRIVKIKL